MKRASIHIVPKLLVLFYGYIYLSTEILSLLSVLNRDYIILFDIVFIVIFLFIFRKYFTRAIYKIKSVKVKPAHGLILALLLLTFVQGLFSSPSTSDSMAYHLPRVMYWLQEETLYQDIIRNSHDFMAPFAEYVLLHLYSFGGDRLLFASQWIAYFGSIILAGVISLQLGANKRTAQKTALLVAILPIAVMEAVSTQTDMLGAVIILITLSISLILIETLSLEYAIYLGISIGLGMAVKANFLFFLVVPLGTLVIMLFKKKFKRLSLFFTAGLIALFIQARYFIQNYNLYQTAVGKHITNSGGEVVYINENFGFKETVSNLVRNIMIHMPVPIFTGQAQSIIEKLHTLIGIPISDFSTTFGGTPFRVLPVLYPQEDIIGNPLHLLLIILTGFFVFRKAFYTKKKLLTAMYILIFVSLIMFSAVLKWQPYHSRLQIPFFMIGTILSVVILDNIKSGKRVISFVTTLSIPLAFLLVIFNVSRPYVSYKLFFDKVRVYSPPLASVPVAFYIKPRIQQYFNARSYWYYPYDKITKELTNYTEDKTIAFDLMDDFEYPLWRLLKENNINAKIIPRNNKEMANYIITTSESALNLEYYETECVKTHINYGYACLSKKIYE